MGDRRGAGPAGDVSTRRRRDGQGAASPRARRVDVLAGAAITAAVAVIALGGFVLAVVPPAVWQAVTSAHNASPTHAPAAGTVALAPAPAVAPAVPGAREEAAPLPPVAGSEVPADVAVDMSTESGIAPISIHSLVWPRRSIVKAKTAPTQTTTAAATATPEQAPAPTTFGASGRGQTFNGGFTATTPWTLAYSYDCSAVPGGSGFLRVMVSYPTGLSEISVTTAGSSGAGAGRYYPPGAYGIIVVSTCSWHLWSVA